jgi:hypothetical protein
VGRGSRQGVNPLYSLGATAVARGIRNLAPPGSTADCWRHPLRRAPRRQELLPSCRRGDVHFSKILIRPFIFRKSSQNKYIKKFLNPTSGRSSYFFPFFPKTQFSYAAHTICHSMWGLILNWTNHQTPKKCCQKSEFWLKKVSLMERVA